MTVERAFAVALPMGETQRTLLGDLRSAAHRARKADPGDRVDVVRFESLSAQFEAWAFAARSQAGALVIELADPTHLSPSIVDGADGALPPWVPASAQSHVTSILEAGGVLVGLRLPLEAGLAVKDMKSQAPPPVSELFVTSVRGAKAVEDRFMDQLKKATDHANAKNQISISPSGIQNRILTETLRKFVQRTKDANRRIDVAVEYRDGSRSQHPFPLRCLDLAPSADGSFDLEVAFSLLSIRHTEMDAIVDGCWLRNVQISQPRAAAETDDLVFDISAKQLDALTAGGTRSVKLLMYQTGLDTAVVGFYRAVTYHLLQPHAARLAVVPQYFQEERAPASPTNNGASRSKSNIKNGRWTPNQSSDRPTKGAEPVGLYGAGRVWAAAPGRAR